MKLLLPSFEQTWLTSPDLKVVANSLKLSTGSNIPESDFLSPGTPQTVPSPVTPLAPWCSLPVDYEYHPAGVHQSEDLALLKQVLPFPDSEKMQ